MPTVARRAARRVARALPGYAAARATVHASRTARLADSLRPVLPPAGRRTVVVLAQAGALARLDPWWPRFAADTVHLLLDRPPAMPPPPGTASVDVVTSVAAIPAVLDRLVGTADVVLDLRGAAPDRLARTWVAVSPRLRDGGVYLIAPPDLRTERTRTAVLATLAALDGRGGVTFEGRPILRPSGTDPDVLGTSVVVDGGAALVKQRGRYRYLPDDGLDRAIAQEPAVTLRILDELPAGTVTVKADVTSHPAPGRDLPAELPHPRLQLRHYEGRIDLYGQTLLVAGRSVLPDSHRFYRRSNTVHPLHPLLGAVPGRRDVALVLPSRTPKQPLPGTYYLLDPQMTGHFGHLMTEVVPRLWGWDQAKRQFPELKTLTKVRRGRTSEPVLRSLLTAYGIAEDDIVVVDHPVELESVVTASAMWHNFAPWFVHPDLPDVWQRIADGLVEPTAPAWDKVFVTRAPGSYRTCHNAAEVEDLFREHGFHVLRPEAYDLRLQAGIFSAARVIAGFGGSAMFNLMFARRLEQLIVLNQESFTARNEHLYTALLGAPADWFWSAPDKQHFHSDWTFDFTRHGAALTDLLASL